MNRIIYYAEPFVHVIENRKAIASFETTAALTQEDIQYLMSYDFTTSTDTDTDNPDELLLDRIHYESLLKSHDWYYEFSDDFSVYTRGRAEYQELMQLAEKVDPKHELYLKTFRSNHNL